MYPWEMRVNDSDTDGTSDACGAFSPFYMSSGDESVDDMIRVLGGDDDSDREISPEPAQKKMKVEPGNHPGTATPRVHQVCPLECKSRKGFLFNVELKRCRQIVMNPSEGFAPNELLRQVFGIDVSPRLYSYTFCSRPIIIETVMSKGPALHDGRIQIGDRIKSINGKPINTLTSHDVCSPGGVFNPLLKAGNLQLKLYRSTSKARDCPLRIDLGENLLNNEEHSDIVFCVMDKEFFAHRLIIADRSPVFAAMFKHNMKEKETSRVVISDFEPPVIETMLRYMYTGYLEPVIQGYEHLYGVAQIADKYEVKGLMRKAFDEIFLMVNLNDAVDMLLLAEGCHFSVSTLREQILTFTATWLEELKVHSSWRLLESNATLLNDILRVAALVNDDRLSFLKRFYDGN